MTIEERALALVNEVAGFDYLVAGDFMDDDQDYVLKALCRALEAHDATLAELEAFKREVSDAVRQYERELDGGAGDFTKLRRFILPKPVDPLVEVIAEANDAGGETVAQWSGDFLAALAKRGGRIVFKEVGK